MNPNVMLTELPLERWDNLPEGQPSLQYSGLYGTVSRRFTFQNKNNIKHKTKTTLQRLGTINGTVNECGPAKAQT